MGIFVKLDERNRLTLPKDAAELFENKLVAITKQENKVVLEPVRKPFSDLAGLITDVRPVSQLRKELEKDITSGRLGI